MNQPTDKHRAEAREKESEGIVRYCEHASIPFQQKMGYVLDALSSRDVEIREVLEGLAVNRYDDELCWCEKGRAIPMGLNHDAACLATQRLWERVRGS